MNIFLIGYRCTGKTTIGKKLAEHYNFTFVDTDEIVQQLEKKSIQQIVAASGWEKFRQLEKKTLQRTLNMKDAVVSTGGGIVLDSGNRSSIRSKGHCIWLSAPEEIVVERLKNDANTDDLRPRLSRNLDLLEETRQMMQKRYPLYERTYHIKIDTGAKSVDECVNTICRRLKDVRV